MSNQELELEVKSIFRKSRLPTKHSANFRLLAILKRGLHELAMRDLINLTGHMTMIMMTLLSCIVKALFKPTKTPSKETH